MEEGSSEKDDQHVQSKKEISRRNSVDEGFPVETPYFKREKERAHFLPSLNRKKRILIVEDDQINSLVITSYINCFYDCVYDVANNGMEAVEKFKDSVEKKDYYHIIFMDCNMPIMDGFEATKIILELSTKKKTPAPSIVAITANISPIDHRYCYDCGMIDYLAKPFTKSQIREKIDEYSKGIAY